MRKHWMLEMLREINKRNRKLRGWAVKASIPIGPTHCIWSNHWCGTWVLRRNNFIVFHNRNWRCRHYKIEIRIILQLGLVTRTHIHMKSRTVLKDYLHLNCIQHLQLPHLHSRSSFLVFCAFFPLHPEVPAAGS